MLWGWDAWWWGRVVEACGWQSLVALSRVSPAAARAVRRHVESCGGLHAIASRGAAGRLAPSVWSHKLCVVSRRMHRTTVSICSRPVAVGVGVGGGASAAVMQVAHHTIPWDHAPADDVVLAGDLVVVRGAQSGGVFQYNVKTRQCKEHTAGDGRVAAGVALGSPYTSRNCLVKYDDGSVRQLRPEGFDAFGERVRVLKSNPFMVVTVDDEGNVRVRRSPSASAFVLTPPGVTAVPSTCPNAIALAGHTVYVYTGPPDRGGTDGWVAVSVFLDTHGRWRVNSTLRIRPGVIPPPARVVGFGCTSAQIPTPLHLPAPSWLTTADTHAPHDVIMIPTHYSSNAAFRVTRSDRERAVVVSLCRDTVMYDDGVIATIVARPLRAVSISTSVDVAGRGRGH